MFFEIFGAIWWRNSGSLGRVISASDVALYAVVIFPFFLLFLSAFIPSIILLGV